MSAGVAVGSRRAQAAGELVAPRWQRRMASIAFLYTLLAGAFTMARALRPETVYHSPQLATMGIVISLLNIALAGLALVVRSAHLRFDKDGIHWGWGTLGFRMKTPRIGIVRQYRGGVAVVPRRGTPWYLSSRDWSPWSSVGDAVRDAGLPTETFDRRAPVWARLQGYGVALDLLLVLAFLMATAGVILIV
jgi:hypothetical protein